MSQNPLPILLVSAADATAASSVISKLVDNDVGKDEEGTEERTAPDGTVTWRLENKYYTADVCVWPLADGDAPPPDHLVEAHVIYLTEDECAGADGGVGRAGARAREGGLRLVLADCGPPAERLARWAAAARHELLALRAGGGAGLLRAREALHAHVWPGLRRGGRGARGGEREAVVERAEAFAAALGALGPAAEGARGLSGAARLDAAEQLVAAFCRALGCDLDAC